MSNSCKSRGWLPIAALAAIGTIFCLPASAQSDEDEGEAAEDDPMVEEIVVTATYRDTQSYSPDAESDYPVNVYWGDTHLHTKLSLDAYRNTKLELDDAYRFAKGETVVLPSDEKKRLHRPLDFLVIADHATNMGLYVRLEADDPLLLKTEQGRAFSQRFQKYKAATDPEKIRQVMRSIGAEVWSGSVVVGSEIYRRSVWLDAARRADIHNNPGTFTALMGFEWSPHWINGGGTPHRVVIFKDAADKVGQVLPFSRIDSNNPEDLWTYLEAYEQKTGGEAIAILHNSNLSYGPSPTFAVTNSLGQPLTKRYAGTRQRWEPLVEATQQKGDSETHPLLSPTDEFSDFERWNTWMGSNSNYDVSKLEKTYPGSSVVVADPVTPEKLQYKYVRSALKLGLDQQATLGINPFKFGLIGSTDSHNALAMADNNNFGIPTRERMLGSGVRPGWLVQASGYAAVWAEGKYAGGTVCRHEAEGNLCHYRPTNDGEILRWLAIPVG